MKTSVTYVKRYYKAKTFEVDIPDNLTEDGKMDFLDNLQENWEQLHDADVDFEGQEILIY